MCIIITPTASQIEARKTKIFARPVHGRQLLVYSMHLRAQDRSAMILPIPIAPRTGENAVVFRDLSAVPDLFAVLARGFPPPPEPQRSRAPDLFSMSAPHLEVVRVGSFEASYVPTRADFVRLDPRFRLSDALWQRLPRYDDWGFVVFQFQPGAQEVHPMAFEFPSRAPNRLFFPAVHVHDGRMYATARYDHQLYLQGLPYVAYRETAFGEHLPPAHGSLYRGESGWHGETSAAPAGGFVSRAALASGVVDADRPVLRLSLSGRFPNEDIWLQ